MKSLLGEMRYTFSGLWSGVQGERNALDRQAPSLIRSLF
jgi:hypothetical protein